ncbi:MAG: ABC transporter substrate-binding protein [Alphaproteobacteria bacterium]|nr:ABC transporter substrate-binding protein [Alphaproteobacteria bacterium]
MYRFLSSIISFAVFFIVSVAIAGEHFVPITSYRTGPYGVSGAPAADGYVDYLKMVNARDGGVGGVKVAWEECETAYKPDRFVECYERLKNKGEAGATVFQPLGTGLTYSVIDRLAADKMPLITMGYGRTDASDGTVFPWVFPLMANYWSISTAKIKFIGEQEGGMDKLKGLKIANVYHDSAYGKETLPVLLKQSEKYGFELKGFPVAHPGLDQKATWLNVRRYKPDYVILRGWGVMNQTAIKEAARARIPANKLVGVIWSCSELDTIPAGKAAKGYNCSSLINPGSNYKVFDDILKYVYDAGEGTGDKEDVGHQQNYKMGVLMGIMTVASIEKATEKYGNKPMSGEQVRWGIENLDFNKAKLQEMGIDGLIPPFKVSCSDHEGSAPVKFQRWNGEAFEAASDWISTDQSIVRPMIVASAAGYAKEKGLTPRCN